MHDLKEFISQSLATQARKGEQVVFMMLVFNKAFDLMCDDIVEFSTEKDALKDKIGSYDEEKWLKKPKAKRLKLIDIDKRSNLFMSTRKNR